jgi:hypothetical protein
VDVNAGARPNTIPVTTARPKVNPRMRKSGAVETTGGPLGSTKKLRTSGAPPIASVRPASPPTTESARLSTSSCCTSRARVAPSERRVAISRCRPAARARRRLATFAQAMTRTPPAMAISTHSGFVIWLRKLECPWAAGSRTS